MPSRHLRLYCRILHISSMLRFNKLYTGSSLHSTVLSSYPAYPISTPGVGGAIKLPKCYIPLHLPPNQNYNKIIDSPNSIPIVQVDEKLTVEPMPLTPSIAAAQKNQTVTSNVKPIPEMYEQLPASNSTFTPKKLTSKEIESMKRDRSPSPSRSKVQKVT